VLKRNTAICVALCLVVIAAVVLGLLQVALVSPQRDVVDDALLFQKNRELVAKDYELREGQLIAARIGLRARQLDRSWLSRVFGGSPEPGEKEVVAHLKSGDQVVIDRLPANAAVDAIIVDSKGSTVGYFLYRTSKDDLWHSHRVTFVIYLAAVNGLVLREGEARCKKIGSEGKPFVRASNARLDTENRELEFSLRSSCHHVILYGSGSQRTLNMQIGQLGFNVDLKEYPWVETAQRLTVSFDQDGNALVLDVAKGDIGGRRSLLKCIEGAKTDESFRICGDKAFWHFGAQRVSYELCRSDWEIAGKTYLVRACPNASSTSKTISMTFNIASQDGPPGIRASIECACDNLWVDHMRFEPQVRSLSFNLETDAKVIKFAGGEFQVPPIVSHPQDDKVSMRIPVFTIHFNEHWQIAKMTAVGGDARKAESATAPLSQEEKSKPKLNEKD
jgi:hypothetical protein